MLHDQFHLSIPNIISCILTKLTAVNKVCYLGAHGHLIYDFLRLYRLGRFLHFFIRTLCPTNQTRGYFDQLRNVASFFKEKGHRWNENEKKEENLQELLESWMCIIWWSGLGGGVPRKLFGFGIIQTLESSSVFRVYFAHTIVFFLFQEMFILTKGSIIIICWVKIKWHDQGRSYVRLE